MNQSRARELVTLIQQLDEVQGKLHGVLEDETQAIDSREVKASDRDIEMLGVMDTAYGSLCQVIRDLEEIVGDYWRRQERQAARRQRP